MMSKEGMIYEIKDTFTQFIPVAKKLVDGDYKNLQHEVLFWANITHLFLQSQTWEYVAQLDIKGYVDIPKAMTEFGLGTYEYMCTNTAKTINRNIVIPYLANLLPD